MELGLGLGLGLGVTSAKRPGAGLSEAVREPPCEESASSAKTSSIVKHTPGVPWRRSSSRAMSRAIRAGIDSAIWLGLGLGLGSGS